MRKIGPTFSIQPMRIDPDLTTVEFDDEHRLTECPALVPDGSPIQLQPITQELPNE